MSGSSDEGRSALDATLVQRLAALERRLSHDRPPPFADIMAEADAIADAFLAMAELRGAEAATCDSDARGPSSPPRSEPS